MQQLDSEGFIQQRRLADGRLIAVDPLLFHRARLGIGMLPPAHNFGAFADHWEFPNVASALQAFVTWEPDQQKEPTGWDRHVATMRYRIGGDPELEYVKWDSGDVIQQVQHAIAIIAGQDDHIMAMADDSSVLGASFPAWANLYDVLTEKSEYSVFIEIPRKTPRFQDGDISGVPVHQYSIHRPEKPL